jgi:hypothetical protein
MAPIIAINLSHPVESGLLNTSTTVLTEDTAAPRLVTTSIAEVTVSVQSFNPPALLKPSSKLPFASSAFLFKLSVAIFFLSDLAAPSNYPSILNEG